MGRGLLMMQCRAALVVGLAPALFIACGGDSSLRKDELEAGTPAGGSNVSATGGTTGTGDGGRPSAAMTGGSTNDGADARPPRSSGDAAPDVDASAGGVGTTDAGIAGRAGSDAGLGVGGTFSTEDAGADAAPDETCDPGCSGSTPICSQGTCVGLVLHAGPVVLGRASSSGDLRLRDQALTQQPRTCAGTGTARICLTGGIAP